MKEVDETMSDAIIDMMREEKQTREADQAIDKLAELIWVRAKRLPSGEARECFITDCFENLCEGITRRMRDFEIYQ